MGVKAAPSLKFLKPSCALFSSFCHLDLMDEFIGGENYKKLGSPKKLGEIVVKFACEIVVKQLLPTLRMLVARELFNKGLTQEEIAKKLGVTQAAISKYLSRELKIPISHEISDYLIPVSKEISEVITVYDDPREGLSRFCQFCFALRDRGIICNLHEEVFPPLKNLDCDLCRTIIPAKEPMEIPERIEVLLNMEKAIKILEKASDNIQKLMPEVRMNIVMAVSGAEVVEDVAAIPGRIILIKDKLRAITKPSFGASHHLAKIVLTLMEYNKDIRAVLNVKYTENIAKTAELLDFSISEFDRKIAPNDIALNDIIIWGVETSIKKMSNVIPDLIYDVGAFGIEPMLYITGNSAVEVAEKAVKISNTLQVG